MEISQDINKKIEDYFFLVDRLGQDMISYKDALLILRALGVIVEDEDIKKKGTNFNLSQFKELYKENAGNKKTKEDLVAALENIFKDGNGSFNTAELKRGLVSISGSNFTKDEIDQILDELDITKSGDVSIEEFVNKLFENQN